MAVLKTGHLLWNLSQGGKLHDNEKSYHHYYLLQILGSLVTNLIVFGTPKTLKFIYTFRSGYRSATCCSPLWLVYPIRLFIGTLGEGGKNSNANSSCFPPSDSWRVVWQHKGKEERLHIKIFRRRCCQTYKPTIWIMKSHCIVQNEISLTWGQFTRFRKRIWLSTPTYMPFLTVQSHTHTPFLK